MLFTLVCRACVRALRHQCRSISVVVLTTNNSTTSAIPKLKRNLRLAIAQSQPQNLSSRTPRGPSSPFLSPSTAPSQARRSPTRLPPQLQLPLPPMAVPFEMAVLLLRMPSSACAKAPGQPSLKLTSLTARQRLCSKNAQDRRIILCHRLLRGA